MQKDQHGRAIALGPGRSPYGDDEFLPNPAPPEVADPLSGYLAVE